MDMPAEGFVAFEQHLSIRFQIQQQPMTPVPADPNPVDQPLIIGMYCHHILSGAQILGDVQLVIVVVKRVPGTGPLGHKFSVEIQFIVVVRRDIEDRPLRCFLQRKIFAKKDMLVLRKSLRRSKMLQLPVEYLHRAQPGKGLAGDPFPQKTALFFLRAPDGDAAVHISSPPFRSLSLVRLMAAAKEYYLFWVPDPSRPWVYIDWAANFTPILPLG